MPQRTIVSPIGPLRLTSLDNRLARISIGVAGKAGVESEIGTEADGVGDDHLLDCAAAQLIAYFDGRLTSFDLPLVPSRSDRGAVLRAAICAIPAGETIGYAMLARAAQSGARAIGQACARNPLPIVVPCHRVVASDGPGHYSAGAGVATKSWLIDHERKFTNG